MPSGVIEGRGEVRTVTRYDIATDEMVPVTQEDWNSRSAEWERLGRYRALVLNLAGWSLEELRALRQAIDNHPNLPRMKASPLD